MTISLKHSIPADGTFSAQGATAWDDEHVLTLATTRLLGRTTAGVGAAEEISAGAGLSLSDGSLVVGTNTLTNAIGYAISGGGAVITTGLAGVGLRVPYACTINSATLLADQTGSAVIDIWKDTYANYPPTVTDSICASAKPTITAGIKSEDTTLTGWTTSIAAGDVLYFNVDSCSTITNLVLTLKVTKT